MPEGTRETSSKAVVAPTPRATGSGDTSLRGATGLGDEAEPTLEQKFLAVVLLAAAGVALMVAWLAGGDASSVLKTAEIAGNVGTLVLSLVATAAGAWWFIRRDPLRPRVSIEQTADVLYRTGQGSYIQVSAVLQNVGDLPLELRGWRLWVCSVDPLPAKVLAGLRQFDGVCVEGDLTWQSCVGEEIGAERFGESRLRSGETQQVVATLLVPPGPRKVRIYSFFPHSRLSRKAGEDRGWTRYTLLTLQGDPDGEREPST